MKRKYSIIGIVIVCTLLSGCAADNGLLRNILLHDNSQYNEYLLQAEQYKDVIDGSGRYNPTEAQEVMATGNVHNGTVRVSFAHNSLLNINYYYDKPHSEVIDTNNCYLNPGDAIYANVAVAGTVQSNTYEFSGFVVRFLQDGLLMQDSVFSEGDVVTIPKDCNYSEISIIPYGHYKNRELSFKAECKGDDGELFSINPVWTIKVGGQEYQTKADSYSVGATSTFRVEAEYDRNKYYLVKEECVPVIEDSSSDKYGTVIFKQYDAQNAENDYKLVFGKKHKIQINSVVSSGEVKITVDGDIFKNPEFPFTCYAKLKDPVEIESTGEITDITGIFGLERQDVNGYFYKVINSDGTIEFDPSNYRYEHGKVVFYDIEHKQITQKTKLNIGDYIYYVGEPDSGYSFSMAEGENRYRIDLNTDYYLKSELKFTSKQKYELPQPSTGGTVTYYINGNEVKGNIANFSPSVDKLTASFSPLPRYVVNNLSDHTECVIYDDSHDIKFKDNAGNEIGIDNVFRYSDEQKANLRVTLDGNVGQEIKFYIYNGTDGPLNNDQQSYVPYGWGQLEDAELLNNYMIKTDVGVKVSVSDWSQLKDEAIRLYITKTDNNNVKAIEIFYILSAGGSYPINTDSGDSVYYKNIDIRISKVSGTTYNSGNYIYNNANVVFNFEDVTNKDVLKDGEFVDFSRNIHMNVTAKAPYTLYKTKDIQMFWDSEQYEVISQYDDTFAFSQIAEKYSAMTAKTKIE